LVSSGSFMRIGIVRREGESWRECAIRYAKPWNLQDEVGLRFDFLVASGERAEAAAFLACESSGLGEPVRTPFDMPES
jgi:hypothetical protein